jgi:pilus assembly protein Flp/PilA
MVRRLAAETVRFLKAEDGPTAVEYAVMLALIIVVCAGAVANLGTATNNSFSNPQLNSTLTGS